MLRALLLSLAFLASLAQATEVRSVRVKAGAEHTRATIDLSAAAEYRLFTLTNPDRLVVDILGGSLRSTIDGPGDGVVRSVRSGRPESGRLRVVFDLTTAVKPKSFLLEPSGRNRHRLVVEMRPAASTVVAATAARPEVPATVPAEAMREVVVAIDAGHGGQDPGAIGAAGTHEKTITLKVARLLAQRIDDEPGMRAVLIRDDDRFVALTQRFQQAREHKADLFVSIHADAAHNRNARGSSVYMLSTRGATNEAARFLAERENQADLVGGVSLGDKDRTLAAVLLDLSQGATLEASALASEHVLAGLTRMGKAHKRQVERANFVVLRSPDVPSLLVETGFISNPEEERKLNDPRHRARVAEAVMLGIRDYFHATPPPGTWIAANAKARAHVVMRGETLSEIASRHGVSVRRIRQENELDTDMLRVGLVLKIPTSS
ncbi:MAG: N-acetylmuramoyl-L-alanine amidase [Lysobacterales bacterium]